jgi:peptide subunit release factor 1 (eRF1)
VARPRTVGALLIRRGGAAVGVFQGRDLVESKVETAYVQARTKAGGWSQQRYARRRDNQARGLVGTTTEVAVRLLLPRAAEMALLVRGGDANLLDTILSDERLAPVRELASPRVLPVPDPRQRVLASLPDQFLAVTVRLNALA